MCWFEIRKDPTQTCEPNPNPCNPAQNPKLENQPKATQTQLKPAAQPFPRPTPPSPSPGPTPLSFPSRDGPRQPPRSARATAQRSPPPARSPPRVALSPCAPGPSVGAARPHRARASPAPLTERPHPSAPTCQPAQRPRPSLPATSTAPRVRVVPFLAQRPRLARRNSRRAFLPGRGRRDIRRPPLNRHGTPQHSPPLLNRH